MAIGTNDESLILEALVRKDFVMELFEVGLLGNKTHLFFAASPDGIALIKQSDDTHIATIEIKSCVKDNTINNVLQSVKEFGQVVNCHYKADTFKKCV